MAVARNDEWTTSRQVYSRGQVEAVLNALGIKVIEDTVGYFMSLCPYHGNTDTPAFSTNQVTGDSMCFNPACEKNDEFVGLEQMVREIKHLNHFEAKRFVLKHKDDVSFEKIFDSIAEPKSELMAFSEKAIATMEERFWNTLPARAYMEGRGFKSTTMRKFHVGFTPASRGQIYRAKDMVVVPAYDHKSRPVGLVGRSIEGKVFKNYGPLPDGRGFHKSQIVWNLNNARRYETCIITEATFDGMAVDQAGYSNVGALLGGTLSETQKQLLRRHFNTLIIMTDNENKENNELSYSVNCRKCLKRGWDYCQGHAAGRELGMQIANEMKDMRIKWAVYDDNNIYANNVKDARGMNDDEIAQCIRNAISHYDYLDLVS